MKVWRRNGLKSSSCGTYARWVKRYQVDCAQGGYELGPCLTREKVQAFARRYARRRHLALVEAIRQACRAVRAWSWALKILGQAVPEWSPPRATAPSTSPLLREFVAFRRSVRGLSPASSRQEVRHVEEWLRFVRSRGCSVRKVRLREVDAYVIRQRRKLAPATVASIGNSLRAFLRFLHATGRLPVDLASSLQVPLRGQEHLPRALSWPEVQRLVRSVDRRARTGLRNHVLLLMMSAYGLGAAEVLGLRLEDVDWVARTLVIRRPKTSTTMLLPLLPSVARALACYLHEARPADAPCRAVFLRQQMPPGPLTTSAIGCIVRRQARRAGITAAYVGGHVLRHSHACRQVDQQAPPKVLSDILGHRNPESTSVYTRVALKRLRGIALPVPR
jgi:site-specific recombinase XerD